METRMTGQPEEATAETPEDVAILYSWANLHGAKYRDFSASRREFRAQVRHRAAQELGRSELAAKTEAERAAVEAERIAREAERIAREPNHFQDPYDRELVLREAEEATRRAAADRTEAARRGESATLAQAAARREEREMAEAHLSAQRQAARWNASEVRRRSLAGPQPASLPAQPGDPYQVSQGSSVDGDLATPNNQLEFTQPQQYRGEDPAGNEERVSQRQTEQNVRRPRGYFPDQPSGFHSAYRAGDSVVRSRTDAGEPAFPVPGGSSQVTRSRISPPSSLPSSLQESYYPPVRERRNSAAEDRSRVPDEDPFAPAWLHAATPTVPLQTAAPQLVPQGLRPAPPASTQSSVADTLQHSRERVASRWFALKGVFDPEMEKGLDSDGRDVAIVPTLALFSIAGGVGKTSMAATLGRTLSSLGEKVLLADTTSHGLLPYYFGATELKPGVVRTFSPPSGSSDAPIHLVSYDIGYQDRDRAAKDALAEEIAQGAASVNRLIVDFSQVSGWLIRRLARHNETVLVPLAADMNSVISLQAVEKYFAGAVSDGAESLLPFYVLNQFDASLPLHLDVREVLKRRLGERLLPFVIRRSPAVSEALAEGMTVVDYQPEGGTSADYLNLAKWVQSVAAPALQGTRNTRWSER